jgi:isopenicillin-N epimerase
MPRRWEDVRADFDLVPHRIHLAGLTLAGHPRVVREAIARNRLLLDSDPHLYMFATLHGAEDAACAAVARYFGAEDGNIALTDGTTMGLALMYAGITIRADQHILTTIHEFSGALECLEFRHKRCVDVRTIPLYKKAADVSEKELQTNLLAAIEDGTRVLALTWVYSNTGLKLPIAKIAQWLRPINKKRKPEDRILLCVDGVHGFGIENRTFTALGCDFFVAGCHKGVHGPRGTGVWCGTAEAWQQCDQVIPTSSRRDEGARGRSMSPGGVHSFENRWALDTAFGYLSTIGAARIEARIHTLATRLKTRLKAMKQVTIVTPLTPDFSSGLVCFDLKKTSTDDALAALLSKNIVASRSSMDGEEQLRHVRISISIFNSEADIDDCADAVSALC